MEESIKSLNIEIASSGVSEFSNVESIFNVLVKLRKDHVDVNEILSVLGETVHPRVYYETASLDAKSKTVSLTGFALSPMDLSRQVSIYSNSDKLKEYEISNVSLAKGGVSFNVELIVK